MKIIDTIEEIKAIRNGLLGTVAFVPTMGYLHDGHLSLVDAAKKECQHLIVSIFVNPAQFGPSEDLSRYPKDFERDRHLLEERGVDYLFFPNAAEIYPNGFQTYVVVENLSQGLCGTSRPGHFRGVATVVLKLFHIVRPDTAYFGQKDAQQCAVICRMVRDLDLDVSIRIMPIIRDSDGLALSSRNQYLSEKERIDALILPRTLLQVCRLVKSDQIKSRQELIGFFNNELQANPVVVVDYIDVLDPLTMIPLETWTKATGQILVVAAVQIGRTRLIDNSVVDFEGRDET